MKKRLAITILFVMMLTVCTTMVQATTNASLADELYAIGSRYGATAADKIKIERYLTDNPVTDDQANAVMAKANEIASVMDNAGVTSISQLSTEQKDQIKSIANEAASVVGVTLAFKNQNVEVYKDGRLIESTANPVYESTAGSSSSSSSSITAGTTGSGAKLVYTGNSNHIAIAVGLVVLALITAVIIRKKVVNA